MHDRCVETVFADVPVTIDGDIADHAEPVDAAFQRAELVGQLLGQHGNHAARKIHRCAAFARVTVERIAVADVVADVGDGDDEPEALAGALAIDRIVEILRRLAVDGDERQVRDVDAALAVGCAHFGRQARGLPSGDGRERVRQVVLAQRDLDFHSGVGVVAEHVHHLRQRLAVRRGLLDQFGDNDLACFSVAAHVWRH